jgi:hypothetical protein
MRRYYRDRRSCHDRCEAASRLRALAFPETRERKSLRTSWLSPSGFDCATMPHEEAIDVILEGTEKHFDPAIADA